MIYTIKTTAGYILSPFVSPISARLSLQTGYAGELTIDLQPDHPLYDKLVPRETIIEVYENTDLIYTGEVKSFSIDIYGVKTVHALDRLSWLADSITPQREYHNYTTYAFLNSLLTNHNTQMSADRKCIRAGTVSSQLSDTIYRMTNRETTLEAIRDKLTDRIGGFLKLRNSASTWYLDYLTIEDYGKISNQEIRLGDNLLSYTQDLSADQIYTGILPLGARLDEQDSNSPLEKRVTIASATDGTEYLINTAMASKYGRNIQVVEWDDVHEAGILKTKAQQWLQENCFENLTITLTASDLSALGIGYDAFRAGDRVRVIAKPFDLDKIMPIMEIDIDLLNPAMTALTLSDATVKRSDTLTGQIASEAKKQTSLMTMYNEDVRAGFNKLQSMLNQGTKGYKLTQYDTDGNWVADLYMDSMDSDVAQNVIKITMDGIGFSTHGINGPFNVGITIDGQLMSWMITAQSITTAQLTQDCITTIVNDATTSSSAEMTERLKDYLTSTEIETKLQTTADSITAGVYTNIAVGAVNLLNGSKDFKSWSGWTSGKDYKITEKLFGEFTCVYHRADSTDQAFFQWPHNIKLESDTTYCLSFFARGASTSYVGFRMLNTTHPPVDYKFIDGQTEVDGSVPYHKLTSTWTRYSITFKTPVISEGFAEYTLKAFAKNFVYFSQPHLEKATIPSAWSASPADLEIDTSVFATKSELSIERNKISAIVSQGSTSTSWVLDKNAFTVCFNSLSDYLQMTGGEIKVMDSSGKQHTTLGRNGLVVYKTNGTTELGHIGRAVWADNDSLQGLAFNLNYYGNYITWGCRTSSTATTYTTQLVYYADGGTGHKKGFDLGDNFYAESYLYIGDDSKTGHFTQFTDGTVGWTGTNFYFENGKVVAGGGLTVSYGASCDVWTNINMHGYNLTNTSDSRLKTNIEPDTHDALEIINSVDIVQYDWADGHGSDFGLIAQQLESVAPDLVSTDSNGIKSIKLDRLLMLAIKAIQELSPTARSAKAEWTDDMTDEEKVEFATALNPVDRPKYERRKPKLMYRMLEEDEEDVDHDCQTE